MSADDAIAAFRRINGTRCDILSLTSEAAPRLTPAAVRWNLERTPRATLEEAGYSEPDIEAQAAAASLARLREAAPAPLKPLEVAIRRAEAYDAVHSGVYAAFVPPGHHLVPSPEVPRANHARNAPGDVLPATTVELAGPVPEYGAIGYGAIEHVCRRPEGEPDCVACVAMDEAVPEPVEDSPSDLNELYGTEF